MKNIKFMLLSLLLLYISCGVDILDDHDISNSENDISKNVSSSEIGFMNAYKRAHQFMDICWEASSPIPMTSSHEGFKPGRTYISMPYSSVKEYNKFIGYDVSIKTFMTALHNKYSLLYTEDVLGSRSQSLYGITYKGVNCGAYMGIVCTFFVDYALGLKIPYVSYEYAYLAKKGIFEIVDVSNINRLKVMDIIWEPGHASILTELNYDSLSNVESVVWSESVSPSIKSTMMTPDQFYERLSKRGGTVYRYNYLDDKPYVPSEFVAVTDESITPYRYNEDICTFAGDYACFREGDLIVINYEKGEYKTMEIIKDEKSHVIIELPEDPSCHSISLQDYQLTYGMYKARLLGKGEKSDFTFFEVIQCDVNIEENGNNQKIHFHSSNGVPVYLQFCNRQGDSFGKYVITETDIKNGYAIVNARKMLWDYRGKGLFGEDVYLKVFFQGNYGRVTNHLLKTSIN